MNNVRRTLVKSYGILFPVVEASGVKHFHSPAAGKKSNKRSLLFKHDRRCLCTFVILLRATHMFKCVFKTKPTVSHPPPGSRGRGNGKGKVFFLIIITIGYVQCCCGYYCRLTARRSWGQIPFGALGLLFCSCPSSVGVVLSSLLPRLRYACGGELNWLLTSAVKAGACRLWPSLSNLV